MRTLLKFLCMLFFAAFLYLPLTATSSAASDGQSAAAFSRMWKSSIQSMDEALAYLNSGKDKEDKEWYRIGREPKFKALVRKTFEVLSVSDAREKIDLAVQHRKTIAVLNRENSDLYKKMPGAQEKPEGLLDSALNKVSLLETRDSINRKITENKEHIKRLEEEITRVKDDFYADMQARCLGISKEQVESLFSSIDGEGIVSIMGMAENIKAMQLELQKLVKQESENIELLKSYSGIYMMLNETLLFAYEEAIDNIEKKYLPKLDLIVSEARSELKTAKVKLQNTARSNEVILKANVRSNGMTINVGERYKNYLKKQTQFLLKEKDRLSDMVEVATNTYNTIRNSGDLLLLIQSSQSDINQITAFQIPELEVLHDESLRKEFDAITSRLQI